jgi:hypothetical protein
MVVKKQIQGAEKSADDVFLDVENAFLSRGIEGRYITWTGPFLFFRETGM